MISTTENSNKLQKTRFWKGKISWGCGTLGPTTQATLVSINCDIELPKIHVYDHQQIIFATINRCLLNFQYNSLEQILPNVLHRLKKFNELVIENETKKVESIHILLDVIIT